MAFAIVALCTTANAQVSISKTVDMNDTTSANKADVDAAKQLLKKYGNVASYGTDTKAELDSTSTVEVWELQNVKSRVKGGASTQYVVKFTVAGKERVIVTHENPTTKLDAAVAGTSGCNCFSVKQGDDDGSDADPDLMK